MKFLKVLRKVSGIKNLKQFLIVSLNQCLNIGFKEI
jgi:hypothetical protein